MSAELIEDTGSPAGACALTVWGPALVRAVETGISIGELPSPLQVKRLLAGKQFTWWKKDLETVCMWVKRRRVRYTVRKSEDEPKPAA